jgi:hypothetical protein
MFPTATLTRAAAALSAALAIAGCDGDLATDPPLAADDVAATRPDEQVVLSLMVNDVAVAPATLDVSSLDIDPATPGAQWWITTDAGRWLLDCSGDVLYVPAPGFTGQASTPYTIADSLGRVSAPAHIVVTVKGE